MESMEKACHKHNILIFMFKKCEYDRSHVLLQCSLMSEMMSLKYGSRIFYCKKLPLSFFYSLLFINLQKKIQKKVFQRLVERNKNLKRADIKMYTVLNLKALSTY